MSDWFTIIFYGCGKIRILRVFNDQRTRRRHILFSLLVIHVCAARSNKKREESLVGYLGQSWEKFIDGVKFWLTVETCCGIKLIGCVALLCHKTTEAQTCMCRPLEVYILTELIRLRLTDIPRFYTTHEQKIFCFYSSFCTQLRYQFNLRTLTIKYHGASASHCFPSKLKNDTQGLERFDTNLCPLVSHFATVSRC